LIHFYKRDCFINKLSNEEAISKIQSVTR